MPLTAIDWNDETVMAQNLNESDRNSDYYTCKSCHEEMILVLPKTDRINHFRHKPGSNCKYASESIKHLEAKMFFYNVYLKKYPKQDIELEKRVGDRIGDLVVGDTVIEIQNSSISETEIDERFNDWNNAGYQMLWIITDNVISPHNIGEKRIPNWVRKLHKIYMGRVYLYSDNRVYGVHFYPVYRDNEWTGGFNYVKTIKDIDFKNIEKYSIFKVISGGGKYGKIYTISRFYDQAWWKKTIESKKKIEFPDLTDFYCDRLKKHTNMCNWLGCRSLTCFNISDIFGEYIKNNNVTHIQYVKGYLFYTPYNLKSNELNEDETNTTITKWKIDQDGGEVIE